MIYTGCFFDYLGKPEGLTLYSIACKTPAFWKGKTYSKLAPPWELVEQWKRGEITWEVYEAIYRGTVLDTLDVQEVANELGDESIICCWERPGKSCHRHIVAAWFLENGILCNEVNNG